MVDRQNVFDVHLIAQVVYNGLDPGLYYLDSTPQTWTSVRVDDEISATMR